MEEAGPTSALWPITRSNVVVGRCTDEVACTCSTAAATAKASMAYAAVEEGEDIRVRTFSRQACAASRDW